MRRARSVRTRITVVAVAIVAAVLGIGAVGTVWLLDRVLTEQIASQLEDDIDTIEDALELGGPSSLTERDDDVLIALHTGDGVLVNDDDAEELPSPDDLRGRAELSIDDEPWLVLSDDIDAGWIVIARSTEEVAGAVSVATALLGVAVPIAVAIIGVLVWLVAARALGPVERIRRQVDHVSADSLDQRVPRTGNGDEIDRLAGTMNRMLDRVEEGYRSRQRFVSDASHELRSPLATVRQYAELARAHPEAASREELAEIVLAEGTRMQEIVDGLLLLAKLDEGSARASASSDVDLDDLALSEASRVRGLAEVAVDGSGIGPARAVGDARLLARAVRNLVDNAVRHARSTIAISTRSSSTASERGFAVLRVDDDGPGIPETERERVFERFTRLDEARSRDAGGSGLGLAIVREVARAHGGSVRIDTSPLGGARFTLALPAIPEDAA